MISKRFSLQRKKPELCYICFMNRKYLKAMSSVKTKILFGLGCFILTTQQFNSQSMGRPDKRKAA